MADEREAKRTRQACTSCRRKKTRCSGEKPACAFCIRLGQQCEYSLGNPVPMARSNLPVPDRRSFPTGANEHADLASRVALLESRLGINSTAILPATSISTSTIAQSRDISGQLQGRSMSPQSRSSFEFTYETSKFFQVPAPPILKALADVYFTHCHNQPYCYFLERAFRQQLDEGTLPEYLLLAFAATAARYSTHEFFENRQSQAMEIYSRTAWRIILQEVLSSEQGVDLHAVRATNMLAVIDFTAGQHRLGWVKIGLGIRFAQSLRLNEEPDHTLPYWQQEERRRVFWSVYVLDRFASCGGGRHPAIPDIDCTVRLPSSEENFRLEVSSETPTIAVLNELPDIDRCKNLDHFAFLILAASTLGRTVKYCLQNTLSKGQPPWDSRSDFAKIRSSLFSFEPLFSAEDYAFSNLVYDEFGMYDGFDRQRVGHFMTCRGLYHLCGCLLHHPFVLHRSLQQYRHTFPRSFARESLRRCQDHAEQLTIVLKTIQETGCCSRGSFLGYFAVVASSVHQLYEYSADPNVKSRSIRSSQACLAFLEKPPMFWDNYSRMSSALRELQVGQRLAEALIEPSVSEETIEKMNTDSPWRILDYGWLSDPSRSGPSFRPPTPRDPDIGSWGLFETLIGGDMGLSLPELNQPPFINNSKARDWWFRSSETEVL